MSMGRRAVHLLILAFSFGTSLAASLDARFVVYFPQAVQGTLDQQHYETVLVVSNPGSGAVDVTILSSLAPSVSLRLEAGQTQQVRMTGIEFRMGYIRLDATGTVAAAAHLISKPSAMSSEILSEVIVLGQPATSKAIVPVLRQVPGSSGTTLAANTAIAIALLQYGPIWMTLRDFTGAVVSSRILFPSDIAGHRARFVTELFSDLPATFDTGSLTLEFADPGRIPRGFAVTGLYFGGTKMWSTAILSIDVPVTWSVRLKPPDQTQEKTRQLAQQYGYSVISFAIGDPTIAHVLMTEEVARAVVRDPRVDFVVPNTLIPLAQDPGQ